MKLWIPACRIILVLMLFYQTACQNPAPVIQKEVEHSTADCDRDSFWIATSDNILKIGWYLYPNCDYKIIADFKGKRDTLDYQQFVWKELKETLIEDQNGIKQRIIKINDSLYAFYSPYLEGFGSYLIGIEIINQKPVIQKRDWIYGQFPFIWDPKKQTITINIERGGGSTEVWDVHKLPGKLIKNSARQE